MRWWFQVEHIIPQADGTAERFRWYFAQREAVESAIWLYEVAKVRDPHGLMRFDSSGAVSRNMFDADWTRYVLKLATGAGKTKVMSLLMTWSYFHKLYETESDLSTNFLVVAPNIIVLDRLRLDFEGARVFFDDPLLPDNGHEGQDWHDDFQLTVHIQDEIGHVGKQGNLFLSNIHRVFEGEPKEPSIDDEDTTEYFLGPKPVTKTTNSLVDLSQIVREVDDLVVLNDEAHHIHEKNAWFRAIEDIVLKLRQKGRALSVQFDLSATPKHNNGAIFVETVSDYPLVEAIRQGVVKTPVVPDEASRARLTDRQSSEFAERYRDYLHLGYLEWKKSFDELSRDGKKPVLFVMTDDTRNCDAVAEHLERTYRELAGACWSSTPRTTARSPRRRPARARTNSDLRRASREIESFEKSLQGHCLGDDAARRLGRAERGDHCRPARLQLEGEHFAGADAWSRSPPHVSRRRCPGKGQRRRHRRLHGVCREHTRRGRRTRSAADGRARAGFDRWWWRSIPTNRKKTSTSSISSCR